MRVQSLVHSARFIRLRLTNLQDFKGQKLADQLSTVLLSVFGAVAFLAGYITQDIYITLYAGLAGTALVLLLVVPPWPYLNKSPSPFLPAKSGNAALQGVEIQVDGRKIQ